MAYGDMRVSIEELRAIFLGKRVRVAFTNRSDWPQKLDGAEFEVSEIGNDYQRIGVNRTDIGRDPWWVYEEDIMLVEEAQAIPVKPYPQACKLCHNPSRRIGKVILCSNTKCKTRSLFAKTYKSSKIVNVSPKQQRQTIVLLKCPNCGDDIKKLYLLGRMSCANGHLIGFDDEMKLQELDGSKHYDYLY